MKKLSKATTSKTDKKPEKVLDDYKSIIEIADEIIFRTDIKGKFLFANPATLKTTGYNENEFFRKIFFDLIPPEYSNPVKDFFASQIKNKIDRTYFEFPVTNKSGKIIWFGQNTILLKKADKLKGLQCIARDITPRKLVEQETLMLAKILEQTTEMILITDRQGIVQYVNSAFEKITQYSKWEILGKRADVLRTGETTQKYIDEAWEKVLNKKVWHGVIKNRKKDGTVYDEELTMNPVFNELGEIVNIVEIKRDITEEIKQRETLLQAENRYKGIFDNAIEGIYQSSIDGKLLTANKALLQMLGYESLEEMQSLDISQSLYVNPDERKSFQKIMNKDGKVIDYEIRLKRKDGTEIIVLENSRTVTDLEGNVAYYEGIIQDITKRKEAEEKFKRIFENALEGIYQSSIDGKLLTANKALLQMLGYESLEEMQSLDISQSLYVNPDERKSFQKIMDKDGKVIDYEIRLKRKDGTEIIVLENSRTVTNSAGNIAYYEGIIQDITKRKEAENSIRILNAQKDKFLSIVSHDLRAPFNSILGFTEILLDETSEFTPEEEKEFLAFIKQAAEQQLNLLGNLLDWSRLETGRIRFEPKPTDLKSLVDKSIVSLKGNALKKQINLYSSIQENITVNVDENLTLQLFGNLLSNALKFTPQNGSVWVDIDDSGIDFVKVSVNDNGIGIPPEDFDKLFKIDTKYYSRGTEGEEGSGLGLALCAEIVQKHGGKIEIKSEINKGTSFILSLPAVRKSALIVDDNKGDRSLAILYVQQAFPDIIILEAYEGYEAMSLAMSRIPSIIIADFAMPGMDGLRLIQELKQQPQTQNIPVIIITSFESKADAASLIQYGVKEILIKPLTKEDLQKAIVKYI
jgi:PAS domain S-box-containing protein